MKTRTMACLFAMSVMALGMGCGDSETKPDARPGDAGGSSPGSDGPGPKLDLGSPVDANLADAPLPMDGQPAVDQNRGAALPEL